MVGTPIELATSAARIPAGPPPMTITRSTSFKPTAARYFFLLQSACESNLLVKGSHRKRLTMRAENFHSKSKELGLCVFRAHSANSASSSSNVQRPIARRSLKSSLSCSSRLDQARQAVEVRCPHGRELRRNHRQREQLVSQIRHPSRARWRDHCLNRK